MTNNLTDMIFDDNFYVERLDLTCNKCNFMFLNTIQVQTV